MVLLAAGIKKSQKEIAKDTYQPWWGTNHLTIMGYLSQFFKIVNYKHNAKLTDIKSHLQKKHLVIVNWWDDFNKDDEEGGHYSVAVNYDTKTKILTLADPTSERSGIWEIEGKEFNKRWYDTLDMHNRTWVEGWMLWVDPKSKV